MVFQALPGRSRGLHKPPGASRGLQGPPGVSGLSGPSKASKNHHKPGFLKGGWMPRRITGNFLGGSLYKDHSVFGSTSRVLLFRGTTNLKKIPHPICSLSVDPCQ